MFHVSHPCAVTRHSRLSETSVKARQSPEHQRKRAQVCFVASPASFSEWRKRENIVESSGFASLTDSILTRRMIGGREPILPACMQLPDGMKFWEGQ